MVAVDRLSNQTRNSGSFEGGDINAPGCSGLLGLTRIVMDMIDTDLDVDIDAQTRRQLARPLRERALDDCLALVRELHEAQVRALQGEAGATLRAELAQGAAIGTTLQFPMLAWCTTVSTDGGNSERALPGRCLTSLVGADGARALVESAANLALQMLKLQPVSVQESIAAVAGRPAVRLELRVFECAGHGYTDLRLAPLLGAPVHIGQIQYQADAWVQREHVAH